MNKEKILVVEDAPDISSLLKIYFTSQGYEVLTANRGQIALHICKKTPPNLVLLDVDLPDMAGYDVGKVLRQNARTRHIPIIFLTARGEKRDILRGLGEVQADYYLVKPFDIEEVHTIVQSRLEVTHRRSQMHPITNLPTTGLIDEAITELLHSRDWAMAGIRINGFDTFAQLYGSLAGEEVLEFTALLIYQILYAIGNSEDFVGQGSFSPDFVIISAAKHITTICKSLMNRFDDEIGLHYNYRDRKRGYIEVPDDSGIARKLPLMSLSVATISSEDGPFCDTREIRDALDAVTTACKSEGEPPGQSSRSRWLLAARNNSLLRRYSALTEVANSPIRDQALLYISITGGNRQTQTLFQSNSLTIPHVSRMMPVGRGDVLAVVPARLVSQIEEELFTAFESHPLIITVLEPSPRLTIAWVQISDTSPDKLLASVAQNLVDRYRSQGIIIEREPPLLQIQPERFGLYDRYQAALGQINQLRIQLERKTGETTIRKVIRQLTAIIDHDLRNGLRALTETLEVALDDRLLTEDEHQSIDSMQQAIVACRTVQQTIREFGTDLAPIPIAFANRSEITTILPLEDLRMAFQSSEKEITDLHRKLNDGSDTEITRVATQRLTPLVSELTQRIDDLRQQAIQIQQRAQQPLDVSIGTPYVEVGWRQMIRRSTLYCYLLTRNLVLALKGERLQAEQININYEINQVLDMLAASSQHLQIERHLDPQIPKVKMAAIEMQQVLMNLIRNSIDHTEAGEIDVVSACVQNKVVVQVRDTGCGIPEVNAFAIFLLSFSTKVSGAFSGVGLYAVKSLVQRAGGDIFVASARQSKTDPLEHWQQGTPLLELPTWNASGTVFQISLPVE